MNNIVETRRKINPIPARSAEELQADEDAVFVTDGSGKTWRADRPSPFDRKREEETETAKQPYTAAELATVAELGKGRDDPPPLPVKDAKDAAEMDILRGMIHSADFMQHLVGMGFNPTNLHNEMQALLGQLAMTYFNDFHQVPSLDVLLNLLGQRIEDKKPELQAPYFEVWKAAHSFAHADHLAWLKEYAAKVNTTGEVKRIIAETEAKDLTPDCLIAKLQKIKTKTTRRTRKRNSIAEMAARPAPRWLVNGLVPMNAINVLWGPPGSGKSFLALDWSLCTVFGIPFLDTFPTLQGRVAYIAAEGQWGIPKRCLRWLEYHDRPAPDVDRFTILDEAFNLIEDGEVAELIRLLDEIPEPPALVVIDTLARNLHGSDSDGADMGKFIFAAEQIKQRYNCAVLIIHHTGWDTSRERGFSGLRGATDMMLSTSKPGGNAAPITDGFVVKCEKPKDCEPFPPMGIACAKIGEGDESSVVLTGRFDAADEADLDRAIKATVKMYDVYQHLSGDEEESLTKREMMALGVTDYAFRSFVRNPEYVREVKEPYNKELKYCLTPRGVLFVSDQRAILLANNKL